MATSACAAMRAARALSAPRSGATAPPWSRGGAALSGPEGHLPVSAFEQRGIDRLHEPPQRAAARRDDVDAGQGVAQAVERAGATMRQDLRAASALFESGVRGGADHGDRAE